MVSQPSGAAVFPRDRGGTTWSLLPYDKLIWAAGAECFVPDIPGKDLDGALTVRHLDDVFDLWDRLPNVRRAVVINGANFQLWAEASEQGRVAGANAAGDRIKYDAASYGTSFEGMNTRLFAVGDVGKEDKEYKLVEFRNEVENSFKKYWFHENLLCGRVLYGETRDAQELLNAFLNGGN